MTNAPVYLTDESIDIFLQLKLESGVSPAVAAKYNNSFVNLKKWLGDNRELTALRLQAWRQYLTDSGYSKNTIQIYVKRINDYLRNNGYTELCIPKPMRYELQGKTFGYLTVLEPTEKRNRRVRIWRCRCRCGREIEVMTSLLLSGNTRTCGFCSRSAITRHYFRIAEETSILKALRDDAVSKVSASGYTGVYRKRNKWEAVIIYKKKLYRLGIYDNIEDAAKARLQAKELIVADAERMEKEYAHVFAQKPTFPPPQSLPPREEPEPVIIAKTRTDNTSGQQGVSRHRDKWAAKINHKGIRYHLGTYDSFEDAVAVRVLAEECVRKGDIEKLKTMHTGAAVQGILV